MSRYSSFRFCCIAFMGFFLLLPLLGEAACDKDPECGDPTAWSIFTHVVLKQTSADTSEMMDWKASFDHGTNDMLIETETRGSRISTTGSIGLVGGQIMLSKGLKLEPGYEIDALDAPVLGMKLVMIVLGRVFPKGPAEVSGLREINRTDKTGIKFATPSASGYIPAPWRVKGKVRKLTGGTVTYDLALTFTAEQKNENSSPTYSIRMTGELGMRSHPVFRDSDLLDGWTTYGIGPIQIKQEASTVLDYGAIPSKGTSYKTIGDIRAFIAAVNHPGFKDSTKDFTGFWKEKCDQTFGLQIMHQGNEGKYSIVFCGPGGCGDPSESRLTFITGDKRYQVVSEDELIKIGQSGKRETYHRCTKETHPVLKCNE